jgi:hypothetical protein
MSDVEQINLVANAIEQAKEIVKGVANNPQSKDLIADVSVNDAALTQAIGAQVQRILANKGVSDANA